MDCVINDNEEGVNIAWSSQKCKSVIDEAFKKSLKRTEKFKPFNLAYFNEIGNIADSGFRIDDSSEPKTDVLWSSNKSINLLNEYGKRLVKTSANFIPNRFLTYDENGFLKSSPYFVDDESNASEDVIYTNKKWDTILESVSSTVVPKFKNVEDDLICQTKNGTITVDKKFKINDNEISPNVLWSSLKTKNFLIGVEEKFKDDLKNLSNSIALNNSEIERLKVSFDNKLDNIEGNSSHLLIFDDEGKLKDSGKKLDDSAQASENIYWSSQKVDLLCEKMKNSCETAAQIPKNFTKGNIPSFTGKGDLEDSGYTLDDNKIGDKVLWSSQKQAEHWKIINENLQNQMSQVQQECQKIDDKKMNKLSDFIPGTLLKTDNEGNITASQYFIDNNASASPNVIWTSEKIDTLNYAKFKQVPKDSDNLVMCTQDGFLADSGVRVDDECTSKHCIWSAEKTLKFFEKFYLSGYFEKDFDFDNAIWYLLKYTFDNSTNSEYIGKSSFLIPVDGYYHVQIFGCIELTKSDEIKVKIDELEVSNFVTAGKNSVQFVFAVEKKVGETFSTYIKLVSEDVVGKIINLQFFITKI